MSRKRAIGWSLLSIFLMAVASCVIWTGTWNPAAAMRQAYYEKLVCIVPLGSTLADFNKAVNSGLLAEGWTSYPFDSSPCHFMECPYPVLDKGGRITGYTIWSQVMICGYQYFRYAAIYDKTGHAEIEFSIGFE